MEEQNKRVLALYSIVHRNWVQKYFRDCEYVIMVITVVKIGDLASHFHVGRT